MIIVEPEMAFCQDTPAMMPIVDLEENHVIPIVHTGVRDDILLWNI